MKPFRAPRSTVEMRQATVHRKDNSARFKEMEKWMDKNVTEERVKTSPVQTGATRRSPRVQGKQDKEVHSIPCRKGIKLMSEREANECSEHGEVLRWSTDSGEDEYPQVTVQTVEQAICIRQWGTDRIRAGLGAVCDKRDRKHLGSPFYRWLEITTRNVRTLAGTTGYYVVPV